MILKFPLFHSLLRLYRTYDRKYSPVLEYPGVHSDYTIK